MTVAAVRIDADLVRELVATQFPEWADLPVAAVEPGGWDNRTFRLGDLMSVRLPSGPGYASQVAKEQRWLPRLAPQLPLPVPEVVARGLPGRGYPFEWSVYRWLEGEPASSAAVEDASELATTLAGFLHALQRIDATGGPLAGAHSAWRGGPLETYDIETRRSISALGATIPGARAIAVWEAALEARWHGSSVWFHGDVAAGNLLIRDGRLEAVIDFGCSGVGDPSCDTTIAWTLLSGESRTAFREALGADRATWARGRGWALWKALNKLVQHLETNPAEAAAARRVIDAVLAEHERDT